MCGPNNNTRGRLFIPDGLNYNRNHKDSNRSNCSRSTRWQYATFVAATFTTASTPASARQYHDNFDNLQDNQIRVSFESFIGGSVIGVTAARTAHGKALRNIRLKPRLNNPATS